jgi:uncharacterized protein
MKQTLKDIIEDQKQYISTRKTVKRAFPESYLTTEQIVIITGVRRCGKSVLLQQIRSKIPQKDYFLNFDDDRLNSFRLQHFQDLYEVFIELYGEQDYFYFDEIQNVNGWEQFVKRLYNSGKKVFLTGSNAKMLSKEFGTLLTGCYITIELYPFSFKDFLELKRKSELITEITGIVQRGTIQAQFSQYLELGGFPLYLKYKEPLMLKTLYDNILYKDIMVRNQITNEKELKEMVFFIMSNIGKPITYTSLAKVIGIKNPSTIKSYLEFIENTYLIFAVNKMDDSVKTQLRNPKKIYAIDNAIVLRLGYHFSREESRLLENLVFIELKRRGYEIFYHQDETSECDFVIRDGFKIVGALQVCTQMIDFQTKEREVKGLINAIKRYNLNSGYIITQSEESTEIIDGMTIHTLPCWKWLL